MIPAGRSGRRFGAVCSTSPETPNSTAGRFDSGVRIATRCRCRASPVSITENIRAEPVSEVIDPWTSELRPDDNDTDETPGRIISVAGPTSSWSRTIPSRPPPCGECAGERLVAPQPTRRNLRPLLSPQLRADKPVISVTAPPSTVKVTGKAPGDPVDGNLLISAESGGQVEEGDPRLGDGTSGVQGVDRDFGRVCHGYVHRLPGGVDDVVVVGQILARSDNSVFDGGFVSRFSAQYLGPDRP